jgi:hypothetical protein
LELAAGRFPLPPAAVQSLRQKIGNNRTRLVLQQLELRRRARPKFSHAQRMFFTERLLEQSSEELIAEYKARRFPAGARIADLCTGIGGDLMGLARHGRAVAIDRDPLAIRLARANCEAVGVAAAGFVVADAAQIDLSRFDAWHIDPDRRSGNGRSSRPELSDPGTETLERLLEQQPSAAMKLAPAAVLPEQWKQIAELEWVGTRRECRQQIAFFGSLARTPGRHAATVLDHAGVACSFSGTPDQEPEVDETAGSFVYEPHAALLASRLAGHFALESGLRALARGVAYFSSNRRLSTPLAAGFEVIEVIPLDRKRLKQTLRSKGIGRLEVKVRGVPIDPQVLTKELRGTGSESATILIASLNRRVTAVLARRLTEVTPAS